MTQCSTSQKNLFNVPVQLWLNSLELTLFTTLNTVTADSIEKVSYSTKVAKKVPTLFV